MSRISICNSDDSYLGIVSNHCPNLFMGRTDFDSIFWQLASLSYDIASGFLYVLQVYENK